MSLDIQIQIQTLLNLVQANVQQALITTCIAPFPPYYVDHADVAGGTASIDQQATQFYIPINVFIVDQTSLQANVNGTPPGALTPATQATLLLELTVAGTKLSLDCTSVSVPDPAFESAALQIQQSIGTVGAVDLGALFTPLGLPAPTSSTMQQVGGSLLIRFDPESSAADHLQPGENWCAFIDAATMVALAKSKLPLDKLSGHGITGVNADATWAPTGKTPHINVKVTGAAQVPDPFSGNVELDFGIDFLLQHVIPKDTSQSPSELEELVNWTLNIDLGEFVPQFIDDYVAALIAAQLKPSTFGGTVVGPQQFAIDSNLPRLAFGGATLAYGSLVGLQDGMVLGGPVTGILAPDLDTLVFDVNQFPDAFNTFVDCLQGGPPPAPTLAEVSVRAVSSYSAAGKVCSVDLVSPTSGTVDVGLFLAASPAPGTVTDAGTISCTLSGIVALLVANYGQPIVVLLRTTRGVRMLDLGLPPLPQLDSDGNVTNQFVILINNCPGQPVPWWQLFHIFNPLWSVDPPESWTERLAEVEEFESLLVAVTGVQVGEVITFEQPIDGGLSLFTAGANNQVVVPALLATRSFDEQAKLSTVSRGNLGTVAVDSVVFRRVAVLQTPGAISHRISGDSQRAVIVSTFRDRTTTTEIDALGIPRTIENVRGASYAAASARASASTIPVSDPAPPTIEIPGLVRILSVPGHADSALSLSELDDGSYRALVTEQGGSIRVAGIVARWPDMPAVSGAWAISASQGDRIAIFSVRKRNVPKQCCCPPEASAAD